MTEHMLTTVDNPFNPFTQFDEWYAYDRSKGYHSLSLLARYVRMSDDLSVADQAVEEERAIDEVVNDNFSGLHKKVAKP